MKISAANIDAACAGVMTSNGVDVALQQQLLALDRVSRRLMHARALLPPAGGGGVWSGEARRMYVRALQHLSVQVQAASTQVENAIRETRNAIASASGGDRVG